MFGYVTTKKRGSGCSARAEFRRSAFEPLESRLLLSVNFAQTNLVTDDQAVLANLGLAPAARTDPNLVNPWGIALGSNSGLWVAENGTGMAESFDGPARPSNRLSRSRASAAPAPRRPPAWRPTTR